MPEPHTNERKAAREYSQLLRLHERILTQLQRVRSELTSPTTVGLLKEIRSRTGTAPAVTDVTASVEEAIRALKLSESQVRNSILEERSEIEIEGVPELPAHLERFLAERQALPGFTYEVVQDEVRGWMILWKEYTHVGTVRGYGQFYERPYAWLED